MTPRAEGTEDDVLSPERIVTLSDGSVWKYRPLRRDGTRSPLPWWKRRISPVDGRTMWSDYVGPFIVDDLCTRCVFFTAGDLRAIADILDAAAAPRPVAWAGAAHRLAEMLCESDGATAEGGDFPCGLHLTEAETFLASLPFPPSLSVEWRGVLLDAKEFIRRHVSSTPRREGLFARIDTALSASPPEQERDRPATGRGEET